MKLAKAENKCLNAKLSNVKGAITMRMFLQNVLMLGGLYFIASCIFGWQEDVVWVWLDNFITFVFVLALLILCFKKNFYFLQNIRQKHPRLTNYLQALGCVLYFVILFIAIPGFYDGYNAAEAEYNHLEYHSSFSDYLFYMNIIYMAAVGLALLWATYKSFIKQKQ